MARLLPFRAVRYEVRRADQAEVLAPPYDVIGPDERERLARHSENVVHLELPLDESSPGSRYAVAAGRLVEWMRRGVLVRHEEPALYAYTQAFVWQGVRHERRAVMGLLELEPPGAASRLHPHEATLSGPREDRRLLLEATGANTSPIFLLAQDAEGVLAEAISGAVAAPALATAKTPWGTEERLTAWTGEAAHRAARAIAATHLVFADGHHRFASARDVAERLGGSDPSGSARFVLAAIVPIRDPGLLVLPTHRVLESASARLQGLEEILAAHFEEATLAGESASCEERARATEAWLARAAESGRPAFTLATSGRTRAFSLRQEKSASLFADSRLDPRLQPLAVSVLQAVLEKGLGLAVETIAVRQVFTYSHDALDVYRRLEGGAPAAFLLPPTPVADIVRVASAGLLLPQKTTYFLPKMTSGWLLHVHERAGEPWRGSVFGPGREELAREWLGATEVETQ